MKLDLGQKLTLGLEFYKFQDIEIFYDPINRTTSRLKNVMGIFDEEQPCAWQTYYKDIEESQRTASGEIDFLEIGCGNGFWSILFKKNFGGNVLAIDKNPRATKLTRLNAKHNNTELEIRCEAYNLATAKYHNVKTFFLNPPFHIYPPEIESIIPLYARGGFDGQQEFKNQLLLANYHLAENGIIVFIMMCLGNDNGPNYINYIHKLMDDNISLYFSNIFNPIPTFEFLSQLYNNDYKEFINNISQKYPKLYYTNGILVRNGKGSIGKVTREFRIHNKSWIDRINLHKRINKA